MDPKHRNVLRRTRMHLARDLSGDSVASHLYSDQVFSNEDRELIKAEVTPQAKNEKLLDILVRKGPTAFKSFESAVKATTPHLLIQLSMEETNGEGSKDVDLPDEGVDCVPSSFPVAPEQVDGPAKPALSEEDGRLGGMFRKQDVESKMSAFPAPDYPPTPTMDSDCFYSMKTHPRGIMVIINNKDFLPSSGMEGYPRNGTDVDAAQLERLFIDLGFVVQPYRNLSCYEMRKVMKQTAVANFKNYSCLACAVLSHGQEGVIYGTDGTIDIRELTQYFRGENLAGKPKLFFFQACQGSDYMDSVDATDGPADDRTNDVSLPSESDFLFAYSTVPGYYSWRNSAKGSWFVQAIVDVFRQNAHKMDAVRMLTRVNGIVSTKKSQTGQRASHNKRQISSIICQLRKELFFFPPGGPLA